MAVKPNIDVRMNPEFQNTRKTPRKSKNTGKKSVGKMVIAELGRELRSMT